MTHHDQSVYVTREIAIALVLPLYKVNIVDKSFEQDIIVKS